MKPFNLEEARNGAQIVHDDGREAKDWHYFEDAVWPLYIQWENGEVKTYMAGSPKIGLASIRVVDYVPFTKDGFYTGYPTLKGAKEDYPEAIAFYEVSADEDGGNWSIERVA